LIGFPEWLNTKDDYLYVRGNFPRGKWEPVFQALLDGRMQWLNVGLLENKADGINNDKHKVVGGESDMSKTTTQHYQYKYMEDPNCRLFKLGFTVTEVEQLLTN